MPTDDEKATLRITKHACGGTVEVTAKKLLVATGSTALRLPGTPFDGLRVFDSDSINGLGFLPRSVTIVGSGIIAIEYAKIFRKYGADVTMLVRGSATSALQKIGIDETIAERLLGALAEDNIKVLENTSVKAFTHVPDASSNCDASDDIGGNSCEPIEIELMDADKNPAGTLFTEVVPPRSLLLPRPSRRVCGPSLCASPAPVARSFSSSLSCFFSSQCARVAEGRLLPFPPRNQLTAETEREARRRGATRAAARRRPAAAFSIEVFMAATGRKPVTTGTALALETAGVALTDRGHITVDEKLRTSVPYIHAAGDCIAGPSLASTGVDQAQRAVSSPRSFSRAAARDRRRLRRRGGVVAAVAAPDAAPHCRHSRLD